MITFAKKLTTKERNALPDSDFVYPSTKKYPINDLSHALDALSRASATKDAAIIAKVKKAVYKRYPQLKKPKKTKASVSNISQNIQIWHTILANLQAKIPLHVTTDQELVTIQSSKHAFKLDTNAFALPLNKFQQVVRKFTKTLSAEGEKGPPKTPEEMIQHYQDLIQEYTAKINEARDKIAGGKTTASTKKTHVGNCVNSFDHDGECTNPHLPYSDTSHFANGEENAHKISKVEFEKHATVPQSLEKLHNKKDTVYMHDKDNNVHMMYDPKKDVHHFFT